MLTYLRTLTVRGIKSRLMAWQARIARAPGQDDRKLELLTRAIALSPEYPRSYELRSQIWLKRGEHQRAIDDCNKALRRRKSAVAYNNRGVAYLHLGRFKEALADFEEAVKRSSGAVFYANRGVAKARSGDLPDAIADLKHALGVGPVQAWMHSELAKVYALLGKDRLELEHWHRTVRLARRNPAAYEARGLCYQRQGNHLGAINNFDRAIEIDPRAAGCRIHRGESYLVLGQCEHALADFDEAIRLAPSAEAFVVRANARLDSGQLSLALVDNEKALDLKPDFAAAYSQRGLAHLRLGDSAQALADLERAVELDPQEAIWFNNRGYVRQARGEYVVALADFEIAMKLSPKHPNAYKNLAMLRSTCASRQYRNGAEAVSLARRAIELSRGLHPAWHEVLANAYAEAGDIDAAWESLNKACEPMATPPAPVMPEEAPVQFSMHSMLIALTVAASALGMVRQLRPTELWSTLVSTVLTASWFGAFLGLLGFAALVRTAWQGLRFGTPLQHAAWLGILFTALLGALDGVWSSVSQYIELSREFPPEMFGASAAIGLAYATLANTILLYVLLGALACVALRLIVSFLPQPWQWRLLGDSGAS